MSKITVLMPVYNGKKFLREAIESVLNQTFSDYEFLILDDRSTDGSQDIVLSYRDPRIRFVQNEKNFGQMETLNIGVRLSRGRYIARMDQDDTSLAQRFEKQVAVLDRSPDLSLIYSDTFIIDERGSRRERTLFDYAKPVRSAVFETLLKRNFIPGNTVMVRRSVFDDIGLFNPSYPVGAEYDLFLRLTQKHRIDFINEPLAEYRVHAANASGSAEKASRETVEILANFSRSTLKINQKVILNRMISLRTADLAMCYLFQHNRKPCKTKAMESLRMDVLNPKAITALFMAYCLPDSILDYAATFRRGRLE